MAFGTAFCHVQGINSILKTSYEPIRDRQAGVSERILLFLRITETTLCNRLLNEYVAESNYSSYSRQARNERTRTAIHTH